MIDPLWVLVLLGAVGAVAAAAHVVVNARILPRGEPMLTDAAAMTSPAVPRRRLSVLVPARDEAARIGPCVAALLAQPAADEILVLDDGSTDATAAVVRAVAGSDPRVRLFAGSGPPPGWLGKPHACHLLAAEATGDTFVFVDADVVLAPGGLAGAVALLDRLGVDLLTPYPKVVATGVGQRLVQPLLQWSWLTFLPLRALRRSRRPSLTAAGGQLLTVNAAAYHAAGGHAAVRDRVLEDIALARAVKLAGGTVGLADGSRLATCHMYRTWGELVDGYTKSLWAAFGSPAGALAVVGLLCWLYLLPPLAVLLALAGTAAGAGPLGWLAVAGLAGYLGGVAGRVFSARATGGRAWPDALAHPVSVVLFGWLVARSLRHRRRGTLRWKGRDLSGSAR